jgi:hypothetical protein
MTSAEPSVCQCPCGAVRYRVTAAPLFRIICHCSICQRFNDAPLADVLVYRAAAVEQPAPGSVVFDTYRPPPNVQRGHCARCHRAAIERLSVPLLPELVVVPVPVHPAPGSLPEPVGHMFYDSRVEDVDDGRPKHAGYLRSQLAFGKHLLRTCGGGSEARPSSGTSMGKRILDLLILAFWLFLMIDAWAQGRELPSLAAELDLPDVPAMLLIGIALAVAAGAGLLAYRQRHRIMDEMPLVTGWVDRGFGDGAYHYFMRRLWPTWASIISSAVLGSVGLHATARSEGSIWSYAACVGFLALAPGFGPVRRLGVQQVPSAGAEIGSRHAGREDPSAVGVGWLE